MEDLNPPTPDGQQKQDRTPEAAGPDGGLLADVGHQRDRVFEDFLTVVPDAVVVVDPEGRIVFANALAERMFGYEQGEWIGSLVEMLMTEQFRARHAAHRAHYLADPRIRPMGVGMELTGLHKDGREFPVEIRLSAFRTGSGVRVMSAIRDLSEHRQVEEELRTLSHAVEQSPATVVITDPDGRIEYVNPKFTALTGYTLEEVLGKNPRILKSGETPAEEYRRLWETIVEGGEWRGEFHNRKKNGELYWESASISPVRNAEGIITHYVAVKENITQLKETVAALRESEARFRSVAETAADAIVVADVQGKVISWNRGAQRTFGYEASEIVGRPMEELMPERYREAHRKGLRQYLSTGTSEVIGKTLEMHGRRKDGSEFPLELSLASWEVGETRFFSGILRDMTERKQAEKALREAERVRTLVQTAGAAAHEINQPLTVILGIAQILLYKFPADDPLWEDIESMRKAGMRIVEIVRTMEAARKHVTKPYIEGVEIIDFDAAAGESRERDDG